MRWEHHETMRKKNVKEMLEARKDILDDELGEDNHEGSPSPEHHKSIMSNSTLHGQS